jgi:hypothetical protein
MDAQAARNSAMSLTIYRNLDPCATLLPVATACSIDGSHPREASIPMKSEETPKTPAADPKTASEGDSAKNNAPQWRSFLIIVFGFFVFYNANFRDIVVMDPIPATLQAASILREGNFDLEEFRPMLEKGESMLRLRYLVDFVGSIQERDGRLLSSYPVGGPILATPVYAVFELISGIDDLLDFRLAAKLSAALMVALSVGFVFLIIQSLAGVRAAWVLSLAYGAGTSAWSIASQALWQHGPGLLCLSFGILMLVRLEDRGGNRYAALAGAALAFAVVCRIFNVVPALVMSLYILIHHRQRLLAFALPATAIAAWLIWYNLTSFGELTGGYSAIFEGDAIRRYGFTRATSFSGPFWTGFSGLLFSPAKGLFVYTPFMILAFAAIIPALRRKEIPISPYLCLWVIAHLLLISKNHFWDGGGTYGPRYLSELMIPLSIILALSWPFVLRRRERIAILGVLVAASVGVQFLGAFVFPCGGFFPPTWQWRDAQITRCASDAFDDRFGRMVFLEYFD